MNFKYTVGVKGLFPWFKKYRKVSSHVIETVGSGGHLVLTFTDGTVETVPDIAHRAMRVYADYAQQAAAKAQYDRDIAAMGEVIADKKVAHLQHAAQAAQQRHMQAAGGGLSVPIR